MRYLLVIFLVILISCNGKRSSVTKGKEIYLCEINCTRHDSSGFVKMLFTEDDNVYFLSIDSIKFYKKELHNAHLVNDNKIISLINSINISKLDSISRNEINYYESLQNIYTIEIKEKGITRRFAFAQDLKRNSKSSLFLMEQIKNSFDRVGK